VAVNEPLEQKRRPSRHDKAHLKVQDKEERSAERRPHFKLQVPEHFDGNSLAFDRAKFTPIQGGANAVRLNGVCGGVSRLPMRTRSYRGRRPAWSGLSKRLSSFRLVATPSTECLGIVGGVTRPAASTRGVGYELKKSLSVRARVGA
jgi:hypothetical protein